MIGLAKLIGATRRGRGIAGSVAALALAMAVVTPASATILERGSYDFTYDDVYDFCGGFDIEVEGSVSGTFHIRQGQGPTAPVFFSHRRETWQETWTANGMTLTYSASATAVGTRATATAEDPTIFLVHRIFATHGKFERHNGTVVLREAGIFKVSFLWDTATNEFVDLVSFDARGHWPEVDLCAEFE
jgi:hypothetical protein